MSLTRAMKQVVALGLSLVLVLGFVPNIAMAESIPNGYENGYYIANDAYDVYNDYNTPSDVYEDYEDNDAYRDGQTAPSVDISTLAFEVAFLIEPSIVLDEDGNFIEFYRNLLLGGEGTAETDELPGRERQLNIQWMDTPNHAFNEGGWINRIRHRHWQDNPFQMTFRNRIPVAWPVSESSIRAAKLEAIEMGFDPDVWDFELDWSYDSAVLSMSISPSQLYYDEISNLVEPLNMPDYASAREILLAHMPVDAIYGIGGQTLVDWYKENLENVVAHGPVYYRRYDNRGALALYPGGPRLTVEVMSLSTTDGIGRDYIIEVSFESEGYQDTAMYRAAVQAILEEHGILRRASSLRTSTVLARYAQAVEAEPIATSEEHVDKKNEAEAYDKPGATYEYNTSVTTAATPRFTLKVGSNTITDNGTVVSYMDAQPFEYHGTIMIPVAFLGRALGADVMWYNDTRTVILNYQDKTKSFIIGEHVGSVPAQLINGRTFICAEFAAEFFDLTFEKNNGTIVFS